MFDQLKTIRRLRNRNLSAPFPLAATNILHISGRRMYKYRERKHISVYMLQRIMFGKLLIHNKTDPVKYLPLKHEYFYIELFFHRSRWRIWQLRISNKH